MEPLSADFDATAAELLAGVRAGDEAAWRRTVERYERLVLSVAQEMGLSEADAEEVFQATWIALSRDARHIRYPGALTAWIVTATRRQCWRLLRKRHRQPRTVDLDSVELRSPGGTPLESTAEHERRLLVHEALERLPARCRRLIDLLFLAPRPRSYADVARELGIAVGTIGPRRARCLAALAGLLEPRRLFEEADARAPRGPAEEKTGET